MWSVNKLYNYYEQKISIIIDVPYSSGYIGWLKDNGETPSPAAIQEYMNDLFIKFTPCTMYRKHGLIEIVSRVVSGIVTYDDFKVSSNLERYGENLLPLTCH